MLSCLTSFIAGLVFVTLYVVSKGKDISPGNKTMIEIWALVFGACSGFMLCAALATGI